jgi:hypothetical protein
MHSTSKLCSSVSIYTFRRLIPAILILPTFIPDDSHLSIRLTLFFFYLAEPLVRFLLVFYILFALVFLLCTHVGSVLLASLAFIISISFAALAHWGAIPFPTPAGL